LEELKREAEAKLKEAEAWAEKLSASIDAFDDHCRRRINDCLRARLILEIEGIASKILDRTYAKERELGAFPTLYRGKEVWIQAMSTKIYGKAHYDFSAVKMDKTSAAAVAAKMKREHPGVRYASLGEFENKVNTLKSFVSNGKIDQVLGLRAEEVLWEAMEYSVKLLRDVDGKGRSRRRTLRSPGYRPGTE
jgi:hypothetical protein